METETEDQAEEPEPAEEQESEEEQVSEEPETVEETKPVEPRQPTDELKVVLNRKGNRVMIGVQAPDCDPRYTTIEGDINAALAQVPALIEVANAAWDVNPLYPKANLPEPEPPPRPAPSSRTTTTAPAKKSQPSFF